MCDFCEENKTILKRAVLDISMIGWYEKVNSKDLLAMEYPLGVFIDRRGYLRMVDLEDFQCIEAGEKIKINFCPFCGDKISQSC